MKSSKIGSLIPIIFEIYLVLGIRNDLSALQGFNNGWLVLSMKK